MYFRCCATSTFLLFTLQTFLAKNVEAKPDDVQSTYVPLFQAGVESYRQEKWMPCISYFSKAMDDFKLYKKKITSCRRTCHAVEKEGDFITKLDDTENRFFENNLKHTLCLLRCKNAQLGERATVYIPDIDEAFEKLIPYDYLQICYYKAGMVDKALAAAYTFLQNNPGHENMQHNVKLYMEQSVKAGDNSLQNMEPKAYRDAFARSVEAFDKKDYQSLMDQTEKSLEAYLEETEDCRAMCEGSFDQDGMQPDLYIALANHMTYALKCRRKCPVRLQYFDGFSGSRQLIARYYDYLHLAYKNLDQIEEACKAVESYLLFEPNDKGMLKEKTELAKLSKTKPEWFVPRSEASKYFQRDETERKVLAYIESAFEVLMKETKPIGTAVPPPSADSKSTLVISAAGGAKSEIEGLQPKDDPKKKGSASDKSKKSTKDASEPEKSAEEDSAF